MNELSLQVTAHMEQVPVRYLRLVPELPVPTHEDVYLSFQRELAATEQVAGALAPLLANTHFLFEGWGQVALPLAGELKRIYIKAACYAVRWCSDVQRSGATSRAENYALNAHPALLKTLASCDTTPAAGEEAIRAFVRSCLDVHRAALMNGPALSEREMAQIGDGE